VLCVAGDSTQAGPAPQAASKGRRSSEREDGTLTAPQCLIACYVSACACLITWPCSTLVACTQQDMNVVLCMHSMSVPVGLCSTQRRITVGSASLACMRSLCLSEQLCFGGLGYSACPIC
jgi:hypothetical protein